MEPTNGRPHVVIVGGGISGLAAAFFLRDEAVRVTVLEGSPRLGGKLSVSEIAGIAVDEGAEALLVTPSGGDRADRRGRAGRSARRPGAHVVRDLDAGRAPAAAPPAVHGRAVRHGRTRPVRGAVRRGRGPGRAGPRAAAHHPRRRRVRRRVRRGAAGRRGGGPAGGPAARRGLRGPFGGAVLRRDAARAGGRVPAARLARRGGPVPAAAPGAGSAGTRAGGPVFTTLTGGLGVLPDYLAKAYRARRCAPARWPASWRRPGAAGGSPWARRRRPGRSTPTR